MIKAVSGNVQRIEKEWATQCAFIIASEGESKGKENMEYELKLVRSKLEQEVRSSLSKMEEEMKALYRKKSTAEEKESKGKESERVLGEYSILLIKLEKDMKEIFGDDDSSVSKAVTIESMATKDKLSINPNSGDITRDHVAPAGKLGILVKSTDHGPQIHSLLDGSPLFGIMKQGDLLLEIQGIDVTNMSHVEVIKLMKNSMGRERKIKFVSL